MKILVTGGLGLIGHNVVKQLCDMEHEVLVMDNMTDYGMIPHDELKYLISERKNKLDSCSYYLYDYDISDKNKVYNVFDVEQPELVIHLASFPRQKVVNKYPAWGSRVMSEGLLNLLEASKNVDVRKFVYVSSSMVYGDFTDHVTEDVICNPQGQYGIMKLAGEWLVKDYSRRDNLSYTILRPSAVYGPLDVEDRVISKFLLGCMRDEPIYVNGYDETLDFTYVEDAAKGIVDASLSYNTDNNTYNITKSHSVTLLQAAELAVKIVGKGKIIVREKDIDFPSRGALDITKAREHFNFNPTVDVEEGFQKYYDWLNTSYYWKDKIG
jgi:nucleoside-diphosphate-sugar epimerase